MDFDDVCRSNNAEDPPLDNSKNSQPKEGSCVSTFTFPLTSQAKVVASNIYSTLHSETSPIDKCIDPDASSNKDFPLRNTSVSFIHMAKKEIWSQLGEPREISMLKKPSTSRSPPRFF